MRYEALPFAEVHANVLHLLPPPPARVLDIGAGTGRDAAALAALGHAVTAVERTAALRLGAQRLHPSPSIRWLDDHLPDLASVGGSFDAVLLTAVWMHLDEAERARAMSVVAALVTAGGVLTMTLRHGPVPPGRRMFEVTMAETIALVEAAGLHCIDRSTGDAGRYAQPGVTWDRLTFRR